MKPETTIYSEVVARNLRRILRSKGMTAADLAAKSGVTKQVISALSRQKIKDPRAICTLKKLASVLRVPLAEITKR